MASSLNLSLTDELRFLLTPIRVTEPCLQPQANSCVTCYVKKKRQDAEAARSAILEGYQDAIAGRTVAFNGNLRELLQKAKK